MYDDAKKIVDVRVKCLTLGHFDKKVTVHVNEYGWFDLPESYCPVCFLMLDKEIDVRSAK